MFGIWKMRKKMVGDDVKEDSLFLDILNVMGSLCSHALGKAFNLIFLEP